MLGDSVAWGACTVIYLLGQQLHFELFDFSYQVLNVAEVEAASITQTHKVHYAQVKYIFVVVKLRFSYLFYTTSYDSRGFCFFFLFSN